MFPFVSPSHLQQRVSQQVHSRAPGRGNGRGLFISNGYFPDGTPGQNLSDQKDVPGQIKNGLRLRISVYDQQVVFRE